MSNLLVSVILPVFNGEKYLAEAIESVLSQRYAPVEIIVVDDGSSDGSAKIAAQYKDHVRYFYQSHAGPAAARNLGIRQSSGQVIAFIDSDDIWPPDKLRKQIQCLEMFPEADVIQGVVRRIFLSEMKKSFSDESSLDLMFLYSNLGSMIMRRAVFERIGFFNESLPFHEDTDFWIRIRESQLLVAVQKTIALIYRIHGRNMSLGKGFKEAGLLAILQRSLERRRNKHGLVPELKRLWFPHKEKESSLQEDQRCPASGLQRTPVSVILTTGKDTALLEKAIQSLLAQIYKPLEIVVVCGPASGFAQNPRSFAEGVQFVECNRGDLASLRNAGWQAAQGELIAFLDVEEEWPPHKLKMQVEYLQHHANIGYVGGKASLIIDPQLAYPKVLLDNLAFRKNLRSSVGTILIRRSVLEHVGGFDAGLQGMEETDWFLRAKDLNINEKIFPDTLLFKYVHSTNRIFALPQLKAGLLRAARSSIHRKHQLSLNLAVSKDIL